MTLTPELEDAVKNSLIETDTESLETEAPDQKNGRLGSLEKLVARQAKLIAKQGTQLAETRWCLAEMIYKMKAAAAAQILNNPQIQEQLKAALMAKMNEGPGL